MQFLKKSKLIVSVVLSSIIFFSSVAVASAETIKLPVSLKMNGVFVLYTYPEPPYVDEHNRFMIPLRSVCQKLIGAKVDYDNKSKTVSVTFDKKNVKLSIGSKIAKANGKTIQMDTVPVVRQGHIFIPIRPLIDNLNIKHNWNSEYGILELEDERIMKTDMIVYMLDDAHVYSESTDIRDAFIPVKANLFKAKKKDKENYWVKDVWVKNITGKDISEGKADITFFNIKTSGGCSFTNPRTKERSFVKKDQVLHFKDETRGGAHIIGEGKNAKYDYLDLEFLLMVGRTIKPLKKK